MSSNTYNTSIELKFEGSDEQIATKTAVLPGWVLCRQVRIERPELRTGGGIVLPDKAEEVQRTVSGVVVKCGMYLEPRGGYPPTLHEIESSGVRWPLPCGTIVAVHPGANTWRCEMLPGDYFVCKSTDVMLAVEK